MNFVTQVINWWHKVPSWQNRRSWPYATVGYWSWINIMLCLPVIEVARKWRSFTRIRPFSSSRFLRPRTYPRYPSVCNKRILLTNIAKKKNFRAGIRPGANYGSLYHVIKKFSKNSVFYLSGPEVKVDAISELSRPATLTMSIKIIWHSMNQSIEFFFTFRFFWNFFSTIPLINEQ